jgi:cardiolipin synthase
MSFAVVELVLAAFHLLGWISALHVLQSDRDPHATIGWSLALLFISPLAVPFYWVFGSRRYHGYRRALQQALTAHRRQTRAFFAELETHALPEEGPFKALTAHTPFPLTTDNELTLLRDGRETYPALFSALEEAREYILLQSFIIEDDATGAELISLLARKATAGVRVFVLYDFFGSREFHNRHAANLAKSGVHLRPFRSPRKHRSLYHLNFRNHRKITVVDGEVAFTGGLNFGQRYRGEDTGERGPWRDTHLQVRGPTVSMLQAVFMMDWNWTTGHLLDDLQWAAPTERNKRRQAASVFPTGPSDSRPRCLLTWISLIAAAKERLWIATPYIVPNEGLIAALEAAVDRGVEVRILTTGELDHHLSFYAAWFFAERLRQAGVEIYRLREGFLHEKAVLVDDTLASVGTVNFDLRSIHLNFEVTVISPDATFVREVAAMLEEDFSKSESIEWEWTRIGPFRRTLARICRLFAPLL